MSIQQDIRRATCGLSLLLFTTGFTFWGGLSMMSSAPHATQDILLFYSVPLCLSFAAGAILVNCFKIRRDLDNGTHPQRCRFLFVLMGAALEVGVIARLVYTENLNIPLLAISAALIGLGTGFQFCLWVYVLHSLGNNSGRKVIIASGCMFSLGYVIYTFVRPPAEVAGYLVITALLLALFLLHTSLTSLPNSFTTSLQKTPVTAGFQQKRHDASSSPKDRLPLLVYLACIALTTSIIRCIALTDIQLSNPVARWAMFATALAVLALGAYLHKAHGNPNYKLFYSITFPILATSILLLPIGNTTVRVIVASTTFGLFIACSLVIMLQACDTNRTGGSNPIGIYVLLSGVLYLFMAIGTGMGAFLLSSGKLELSTLLAIALALVYAAAMALSLLAQSRETGEGISGSASATQSEALGHAVVRDNVDLGRKSSNSPNSCESYAGSRYIALAATWELSSRETDVLELLSRGRDVPYISESLSLSKNTVRTHIKGIYGKAGVHSRRELLDLLEG